MPKIFMPGQSVRLRGWLGRCTYARRGVVHNPYPIGMYGLGFNISHYYSPLGWCYQVRRTWHGMQNVAERPPISEGTNTLERQVWRTAFGDAVSIWQGMDTGTKSIYHRERYPVKASGYNRFIRTYLRDIQAEMPISPTNIIDHFDQATHDGVAFTVSLMSGEIAQGVVFYLLIKCHVSFDLHAILAFDSEGEWHREIFEDPTITDDGAALTARNRNRKYADGVNTLFYSGPTIEVDGTLLVQRVMGSGKDEAGSATTAEWIFKRGKDYLLKMTNDAGANKHASIRIMFTEEV